jgi:hypothetical protein
LLLFSLCASANPAQEKTKPRDLDRYEVGDRYDLTWGLGPDGLEKLKVKARDYLWEQWQQKRLTFFLVADCVIYPEGCDDSVEYKIYIEPDEKGRWGIVIESEHVVSAWMSGKDKEERTPRGKSVYTKVEKLAAGESADCYPLLKDRSERPSQAPRLRLTSDYSGKDDRLKSCVYF